MRRRQLKWLWKRLRELTGMEVSREEMLMKLGAARAKHPPHGAWSISRWTRKAPRSPTHSTVRSCDVLAAAKGVICCAPISPRTIPHCCGYYIQLVAVEQAFKNLKQDLAIRPVFHQDEHRIEAHIFIAFLAYCLQVTLQRRLHALAPGLTARSALEKFAAVQMIDVHLPTTDGRELLLTRYTQPEPELRLLIEQLKLSLPPQPPPRIATRAVPSGPNNPV